MIKENICNNCNPSTQFKCNNQHNKIIPWVCYYSDEQKKLEKYKINIELEIKILKKDFDKQILSLEEKKDKKIYKMISNNKEDFETFLFAKTATKNGEKSHGFWKAIPHKLYQIEGGIKKYEQWWRGLTISNKIQKIDKECSKNRVKKLLQFDKDKNKIYVKYYDLIKEY